MKNCLSCNIQKYEGRTVILNHTECFCEDCVIREIRTRTNDVIVLNEYEKSKEIYQ